MEIVSITYQGVLLNIPKFLEEYWPFDLHHEDFPTFCGAGKWGDWLVSDRVCGVLISCLCWEHDISWSVCSNTKKEFSSSNRRLYQNMRRFVHTHQVGFKDWYVEWKTFCYFAGVCLWGQNYFKLHIADRIEYDNPTDNPNVQAAIQRVKKVVKIQAAQ